LKKKYQKRISFIGGSVVLVLGLFSLIYPYFHKPDYGLEERVGYFIDTSGKKLGSLTLEIADTMSKRQVGMMYRKKLDENRGMLFVFPVEKDNQFWMKNTFVSLDMVFVGSNLKVVGIVSSATPGSLKKLGVSKPSKYVIEVVAGYADKNNLSAGSKFVIDGILPKATE
jgi:uncharacterized membrane protein (UPF0127 family)